MLVKERQIFVVVLQEGSSLSQRLDGVWLREDNDAFFSVVIFQLIY